MQTSKCTARWPLRDAAYRIITLQKRYIFVVEMYSTICALAEWAVDHLDLVLTNT